MKKKTRLLKRDRQRNRGCNGEKATCLKVIVRIHLAAELHLQPIVPGISTLLVKDPLLLGPRHQSSTLTLELQEVSQSSVVSSSPEQEQDQKQEALHARGESKEQEDLEAHDSQSQDVKSRLFLAHIKDLAQHILCSRDAEDW